MLVFFNRLLGMENWCFSSSIRPERVYWNIIIKTLMQGLYLVAMLWIMSKRHLCLFLCVFWVEGKDSEVVLSPLWLPFANGWRRFEAVSSKTQSLAEQPTCWCRTRARESGLDIFLVLKSCCICFCFKRRKLRKPHCSLAAIRAIWWMLTFCSQRHHQVPRIPSLLNGAREKPDCGVVSPWVGEL